MNKKGGESQNLTMSAGFTSVPHKETPQEQPYFSNVRHEADTNANYSKQLGRNRITVIEDSAYTSYILKDGKYTKDKTGDIREFQEDTLESCLKEVKSNLQRIIEEVERIYDNKLENVLRKNYRVGEFENLTIREIAELLLEARKIKKGQVAT